jgi:hypothetical protein
MRVALVCVRRAKRREGDARAVREDEVRLLVVERSLGGRPRREERRGQRDEEERDGGED